jgi:hypothetical protein
MSVLDRRLHSSWVDIFKYPRYNQGSLRCVFAFHLRAADKGFSHGPIAKLAKATVCKTVMRRFESGSGLSLFYTRRSGQGGSAPSRRSSRLHPGYPSA